MKVGDRVYHLELSGIATITRATIAQKYDPKKDKTVTRTKYTAEYPDGKSFTFFGFDIGKKVFKYESVTQTTLFDLIEEKEVEHGISV